MENTRSDEHGPTLTDVAWLAGVIDGEGYVAFHQGPLIEVDSVSPSLVTTPARLFGGSVTTRQRNDATVFRWAVYGKNAEEILKRVMPYLRYKTAQAKIVAHGSKYPRNSEMRKSQTRRLKKLRRQRF